MREGDVTLPGGRTIHWYDDGPPDAPTVMWHHGTPNVGEPPAPLRHHHAGARWRWLGFDRPGYGGSTRVKGRTVGSVAEDAVAVADALGVASFITAGHSGGGSHALACAAARPDRVTAAVSVAGLAPFASLGLDWWAAMAPGGRAELEAALKGTAALRRLLETNAWDPECFTDADHAALRGEWGWLEQVAQRGTAGGLDGMVDDDVAYVSPWGVAVGGGGGGAVRGGGHSATPAVPVLIVHGDEDRVVPPAHGRWWAAELPQAEYWEEPGQGHISVLGAGPRILEWMSTVVPAG